MRIIFYVIIAFGIMEVGVGVASLYQGHHVLTSVRPPPDPSAGIVDIGIGLVLIAIGTAATRSARQR